MGDVVLSACLVAIALHLPAVQAPATACAPVNEAPEHEKPEPVIGTLATDRASDGIGMRVAGITLLSWGAPGTVAGVVVMATAGLPEIFGPLLGAGLVAIASGIPLVTFGKRRQHRFERSLAELPRDADLRPSTKPGTGMLATGGILFASGIPVFLFGLSILPIDVQHPEAALINVFGGAAGIAGGAVLLAYGDRRRARYRWSRGQLAVTPRIEWVGAGTFRF